MASLSRRALLTKTGIAVGAGLAGTVVAEPAQAASHQAARPTLTLHATALRVLGERSTGAAGTVRAVTGRLHASAGAPPTGELFANSTVLAAPSMFDPGPALFETHLLSFADGTLTGTGLVDQDGAGRFTITGGTGRFAGAHGSYTTRHSADHSGTGDGLFTLTIG